MVVVSESPCAMTHVIAIATVIVISINVNIDINQVQAQLIESHSYPTNNRLHRATEHAQSADEDSTDQYLDPKSSAYTKYLNSDRNHQKQQPNAAATTLDDKRLFVIELLQLLHEQYGRTSSATTQVKVSPADKKEDRQSISVSVPMMNQLLEAIGADGDMRRLVDWVQNSFNLGTISEITTQFVVGKLASVNCAALLKPDYEEGLIPRFLLFNEHYVDVPYELPINPGPTECVEHAKFDALRKTIVIIHGYLTGYTIADGLTNIKNRILDINKHTGDLAMQTLIRSSKANHNGTGYVLTDDLKMKIRQQLYNVIIVDWFNGANPVPRSRYIRAAVNAQVVGKLIARFLSALVARCGTPSENLQILAHSLGE